MATAVIAVAAAVGGGLAGSAAAVGVSGYLASIAVGAIVGAVVGGAISVVGALITGQDTGKAIRSGVISGGLAGAIGGFVAANSATALPAENAAAGAQASGAGGNAATGAQASGAGGNAATGAQAGLLQGQPALSATGVAPVKAGVTAVNPTVAGSAGVAPVEAGATAVNPVGNVAEGTGNAIETQAVAAQPTQQAGLLSGLGKMMPKSELGKYAVLTGGANVLGSVIQGMSEDERAAEAERLVEEKRQRLNTSLLEAAPMSPPMSFSIKDNGLFFGPSYSNRYLETV